MKLNSFEEVKRLTQEMVAIPSINKEPKGRLQSPSISMTITWDWITLKDILKE